MFKHLVSIARIIIVCISLTAGLAPDSADTTEVIADAHVPLAELPLFQAAEPSLAMGGSEFEWAVFVYINAEREKQGLMPLGWDPQIADIARAHSLDMVQRGFFSHINPDGHRSVDRKWAAGVELMFSGETLARGHKTPEEVVAAWMDSLPHSNTLMSGLPTHMGVGFHEYHWTVNLIG
jgi:uncharacterized protein YkwD